jgi:hypothetical protein
MLRLSVLAAAACLCAGCATIEVAEEQSISVVAKNDGVEVAGASCSLSNEKGTWVTRTPGIVKVQRSFNELTIDCRVDGSAPGIVVVPSSTKTLAFGNAVFGGAMRPGIDLARGTAYDYPAVVAVELGKAVDLAVAAK